MALAQVNPGIIMSGQPFAPVTSYLQGLEFRQKADEAKQMQGLRALQIENEKAQMQENQLMQPYRLQQAQQNLDIGKQGLVVGQYQFGKEKEQDLRAKRVEGVVGKFVGQTGTLPYNNPELQGQFISELSKEDPNKAIEYRKHFDDMASAKSKAIADAKQREFENYISMQKLKNEKERFAFDKLKQKLELEKPFRDLEFNQNVLNNTLATELATKRNPGKLLSDDGIKRITDVSVKSPELMRLIRDLKYDANKYGKQALPTEVKKRVESNLNNLQGILKSVEYVNLGVLTGDDKKFLDAITGTPDKFVGFSDNDIVKLNSTETNVLNGFNTIANISGFKPFSVDEIIGLNPGMKYSTGNENTQEFKTGIGSVYIDPKTGEAMVR